MSLHLRLAIWMAVNAALMVSLAAVSPSKAPSAGTFVWHDLVTDHPDTCRAFYSALFGWTFEPGKGVDPGYTIIRHEGLPIGGMVVPRQPTSAQWLSYVVVDDVDRAAGMFRDSGGRVFRGPLNVSKDLRVAAVADSQGAPIGLASRGPTFQQPEGIPAVNRWLWMDYVARDADAAVAFYGRAVGFSQQVSAQREGFTYHLLSSDRPRAGLFATPWEREVSVWLPYVRVDDPLAMAARAKELGGTIFLTPSARARNGSMAIVLDPSGAPLALQKFPFDAGVTP